MRLKDLESRAFLTLVIGISIVFIWLVSDFLMPVFWAAVLAILFRPVSKKLEARIPGRPSIVAMLTTIIVTLVVLIPIGLLSAAVTQQAVILYQRIATGQVDLQAPIDFVERQVPLISDMLSDYGIEISNLRTSIESAAMSISQYLATQALAMGQNVIIVTALFAMMLYFLFFFIRDGDTIVDGMVRVLPLGDERERRLFSKFAEVARATIKGTLVVASVQGGIGGVLFWIVGIEGAVFWAVVMGVLSLLPAVGAFLVWGPAAIYFFVTGVYWKALLLVVGGSLVIGLIDNILRPILVGRETQMPDYLVLLTTLGGLAAFGLSGFVVGPVIAALSLVLWNMFADEYAPVDSSETRPIITSEPDADAADYIDMSAAEGDESRSE